MELIFVLIPIVLIAIIVALIKTGEFSIRTILGAAIAVILVGSLLAPAIYSTTTDSQSSALPDTIYYDDYIEVDSEPSISGVFDYVKYNGQGYIHANDVGSGKIGNRTYTVERAPLDVFLFIGQSNAANWAGVNATQADPIAHIGTAYYFGTNAHQSNKNLGVEIQDYSMYDMVTTSDDSRIGGIDAPFAATYADLTGHKAYVINGAIGGTSINTWVPDGTSYEYARELFEAAWNAIDLSHFSPEIKSYIWIQGEADNNMSVSTYKTNLMSMHETLIEGTFTDKGSFDNALISLTQAVNPTIAQKELADENSTIFIATDLAEGFTTANGYLLSDGLHYTQLGRNLLGVAIGEFATHFD